MTGLLVAGAFLLGCAFGFVGFFAVAVYVERRVGQMIGGSRCA